MRKYVFGCVSAILFAGTFVVAPGASAAESPGVVLINPFEVKPGREAECLAMWNKAADFLRTQPGLRTFSFHESFKPDAKFRYVNVAVWESQQAFQAAVSDPAFRAIAASTDACTGNPALYRAISSLAGGR